AAVFLDPSRELSSQIKILCAGFSAGWGHDDEVSFRGALNAQIGIAFAELEILFVRNLAHEWEINISTIFQIQYCTHFVSPYRRKKTALPNVTNRITLTNAFVVKNAAFNLLKSSARTSVC